jgi:hypothetical protein
MTDKSHSENSNPKQSSEGEQPGAEDLKKRAIPAKHRERFTEGKEINLPHFEINWSKGQPPVDEDPEETP